jgi:HEXXH motif-containing protein
MTGDAELTRLMIGEYGRALLQIALEHCEPVLASHSPSLRDRLSDVLAKPLPRSAVWDPALAQLERLLARPTPVGEVWDGVVALLVDLAAEGGIAEAEIQLHAPQTLWWGAVRLPKADRLAFRCKAAGAVLELSRGKQRPMRLSLHRSARGAWTASELAPPSLLWLGRHALVVRGSSRGASYPLPKGRRVLAALPIGSTETFAEVARLIARVSPALVPWVAEAIRIIVPLEINDGVRMSATIEEFPGLTFLSLPLEPADIATRLVHEASHHYFFALQRLAKLHDGSDTKDYYSPIKERGRTIDMILFAFHAFGNGALFHRDLARRSRRFDRINGNTVEQAVAPLHILHDHLAKTRALTAAGEMLWRPVADRLFAQIAGE